MFSRALRQSSRRVAAISATGRIASVSPSMLGAIAPALHLAIIYCSPDHNPMPLALQLSFVDGRRGDALDGRSFSAEPRTDGFSATGPSHACPRHEAGAKLCCRCEGLADRGLVHSR